MRTLNRKIGEYEEDDWYEYAKSFVHHIGGDVEDRFFVMFILQELQWIFTEGFREGKRSA